MNMIRFLKDWTLPVAIAMGTASYLTFRYVPQLDALGTALAPWFDFLFPLTVFLTLFVTFCKVDFHQMRPHRWHVGILAAQLLLVALNVAIIFWLQSTLNAPLSTLNPQPSALNSQLSALSPPLSTPLGGRADLHHRTGSVGIARGGGQAGG